jgi:hypothetical protein
MAEPAPRSVAIFAPRDTAERRFVSEAEHMNDTQDQSESADGFSRSARDWPRATGRTYRRWCGLAMVVAAAPVGLTACSGGSPDSSHIASLATSTTTGGGHDSASTTTAPKGGSATQLMDEWASCMRANGDPTQTDPTIDQYGVINITLPEGVSDTISSQVHGSTGPCSQYELAAENDLRAADPVAPPPTQAQLVQYVDCMRTHGVPNYPNSGSDGETHFNGTGVDPNSPTVENANKICGKQIHAPAWWIAGTGPPGDVSVESAGIGPNGPTGSHAPAGGEVVPQGSTAGSGEVTHAGSGSGG